MLSAQKVSKVEDPQLPQDVSARGFLSLRLNPLVGWAAIGALALQLTSFAFKRAGGDSNFRSGNELSQQSEVAAATALELPALAGLPREERIRWSALLLIDGMEAANSAETGMRLGCTPEQRLAALKKLFGIPAEIDAELRLSWDSKDTNSLVVLGEVRSPAEANLILGRLSFEYQLKEQTVQLLEWSDFQRRKAEYFLQLRLWQTLSENKAVLERMSQQGALLTPADKEILKTGLVRALYGAGPPPLVDLQISDRIQTPVGRVPKGQEQELVLRQVSGKEAQELLRMSLEVLPQDGGVRWSYQFLTAPEKLVEDLRKLEGQNENAAEHKLLPVPEQKKGQSPNRPEKLAPPSKPHRPSKGEPKGENYLA